MCGFTLHTDNMDHKRGKVNVYEEAKSEVGLLFKKDGHYEG